MNGWEVLGVFSVHVEHADGVQGELVTCLRYCSDDPVAVRIEVGASVQDADPVTWWVSRELLKAGVMRTRRGYGDVIVDGAKRPADVEILLYPGESNCCTLVLDRDTLARFMHQTYAAVSEDGEADIIRKELDLFRWITP